ncbi:MAG: hypothetical protein ACO1TE_13955 [Prosthecobacter sp.]
MKPFPDKIDLDIEEERAAEKAVDALPYGSANLRANEVEAKARADYRQAKAMKEQNEASAASQS